MYNDGRLRNEGADVELEPSEEHSSFLRPKPTSNPDSFSQYWNGGVPPPTAFTGYQLESPSIGQKRSHAPQDDGFSASPSKRRASVDGPSNDDDDIVISDDDDDDLKVNITSDVKSELGDFPDSTGGSAESQHFSTAEPPETTTATHGFPLPPPPPLTDRSSVPKILPSCVPSLPVFDFSWVATDFITGSKKARVILSDDGISGWNEVSRKILDSLLYDLGKAAVMRCPPRLHVDTPFAKTETRHYVDSLFNEWCSHFTHMSTLEKLELNYTPEKKMLFKVYMRARLSNSFSSVRRARIKQTPSGSRR